MTPFFETDNGTLYCGDCLEIMQGMPDGSVDLTVTSPPYDNLRDYNGYDFNFEGIAYQLFRVTKKGGVVVWIVADTTVNGSETGTSFKQALHFKDIGFNLHDTMIWTKDQISFPDKHRYYNAFEYMFIFSNGPPKTFNQICDKRNKGFGGVVHGSARQANGKLKRKSCLGQPIKEYGARYNHWLIYNQCRGIHSKHPATFPEQLAHDHIVSWSNRGDTILEPFAGSGTTAKMCEVIDRKWIGIEISETYCQIAKERIHRETRQMKLF